MYLKIYYNLQIKSWCIQEILQKQGIYVQYMVYLFNNCNTVEQSTQSFTV